MSTELTPATTAETRFIQIDEEGYFMLDGLRVSDAELGHSWLRSLRMDARNCAWCEIDGQKVLVESFDEPYVALDLERDPSGNWSIHLPYGHRAAIDLDKFSLDEWDRFHGRTQDGVPFVLNRAAQSRFFDMVDAYDDTSVTVDGRQIETPPWLVDFAEANQDEWWTQVYLGNNAGWELHAPAHALTSLVPKLKLQRSRILVPGAGSGNDAAWFAEQGHIVTAVDFSEEALARAHAKYGHISGLKFLRADVFDLPEATREAFDIVFEHTLYCAITPSRRNELVRAWRRALTDQGSLMGVFFTMDKRTGPPFGASEWELRARLSHFRPLYWTRLRDSLPRRLGHELFVYAQKLPTIS